MIDAHGLETIDLLKVDVEGAELDCLRGIDARHWPRLKAVALEVHDVDGQLQTIEELLRANGIGHISVLQLCGMLLASEHVQSTVHDCCGAYSVTLS